MGVTAPRQTTPRGLIAYVRALTACAVVLAVISGARSARPDVDVAVLIPFVLLLAAGAAMILRFQYRNHVLALELFEAVLIPAVFAFQPAVVVVLVIVSQAIANAVRHNEPLKGIFNVSMWTSAAAVASLSYHGLRDGESLTTRNVVALMVSMTVAAIVNTVALTNVLRLASGQPFGRVLHDAVPALLMNWTINSAFGLLFVTSFARAPAAVALFLVPMLVLRWSHRSYAAVLADTARVKAMHRATIALAAPIDPREAFPMFAEELRACFDAEAVDLVGLEAGGRLVYRARRGLPARTHIETEEIQTLAATLSGEQGVVRVRKDSEDAGQVALLVREGWRECVSAPLVTEGRRLGTLCIYDPSGPEGFEEGGMAVLETLAAQAAAAMLKGTLVAAIIEERQKLSDIMQNTSDGIFTVGADRTILLWNPAMEILSGYPANEMLQPRSIGRLHARDAHGEPVALDRWALGVSTLPNSIEIRTSDGEDRWLSCSYSTIGEPEAGTLVVVARDVTRARELERSKDDFIATVSHELRTPLTPIRGWAQTLYDAGERLSPEERREGVASILRQAQHLERLITSLLVVARIEHAPDVPREGVVHVRSVVEKAVSEFRSTYPERTIELSIDTRATRAQGDDVFLEQIVSNLLSNAIKYSPATEPIGVRIAQKGRDVILEIADHGPGIPARETERIFERFHRLGDVMTRPVAGTGLGLYIARELTRSMNGTLNVRSEVGAGSTFTLSLAPAPRLAAVG